MDWLKEVEYKDLLTNDTALIETYCGEQVLLALWENLPSMNLFISTKPLTEAKKRFIRKFYNNSNAKELAAKLNVSERFVYECVSQTDHKDDRQGSLI